MRNKVIFVFLNLLLLTGCSTYKSTWDCPLDKGIGCSSVEYADEIAKQEIQLNTNNGKLKEVFINESYFDYGNLEDMEAQ